MSDVPSVSKKTSGGRGLIEGFRMTSTTLSPEAKEMIRKMEGSFRFKMKMRWFKFKRKLRRIGLMR